jgi:carbon starvation protein
VLFWGYFIYTGSVATIWPMFGSANQLLAGIALTVGTSYLINHGKIKYAWITLIPMVFVLVVTFIACFLNMKNIYIPQLSNSSTLVQGIINLILTILIMISALIILRDAVPQWFRARRMSQTIHF